ncbi:DUF1831 domain-containing protein [Lentilactobacillus sp. SPB1-3]|uniref:DUF1831 domain-containing protein n=1 Tax=Lentilactobacillus terminaliae TaxID=3003483 RepID=A0ACD5DD73_9LACO|nr:DUF1831 domain-containing protein [Lentilactobacillus sp. SPB1-3]MCZ0977841.1 DUF1831 domain-containing protein [Lentilactobacillus sp. SPB1-3]
MAFVNEVTVQGDSTTYEIASTIKKFTLKDMGFVETKNGNYSLERSLDPTSPYNASYKLKIMIDKDLTGFKMSTTTGNGLAKVNIFKSDDTKDSVEQFRFVMKNLIDRGVFKVK